jgi:tetratricopeptide (TPR) repeat protein
MNITQEMNTTTLRSHLAIAAAILLIFLQSDNAPAQNATEQNSLPKIGEAIENGNWPNALQLAEAVLANDPKNGICMVVEDSARFITKKPKRPIRSYTDFPYSDKTICDKVLAWTQDLLVNNPTNVNLLLLNGIFYTRGRRDFERGTDRLEKALNGAPTNVFALACLGACYGGQNRLDEAVKLSERALKIDPDCATAYSNLGMAAMTRGDRTKAEEYFQKAITCSDADGMDWFNLGSLQIAQGQLPKGKATLLEGLEVAPNLMELHWNLSSVYYSLGQMPDCIRECKKVVELAPDSVQGQKAKNNLRLLGQ